MIELDGLHNHLDSTSIPLDESWYKSTKDTINTNNKKNKSQLVKLYEKIKNQLTHFKTNNFSEENSIWKKVKTKSKFEFLLIY